MQVFPRFSVSVYAQSSVYAAWGVEDAKSSEYVLLMLDAEGQPPLSEEAQRRAQICADALNADSLQTP